MQIITVAIQKGGTGKTATATALAQAAAYNDKKVLAIDLDPQGNMTNALGAVPNGGGSYELIAGTAAPVIIHSKQNIDVIAASWDLSTLTSSKGSARRLQNALEPIKRNYDYIIIDTPPTAGELQYNALQASTDLIIPLLADTFSLNSLYQVVDTAKQFQATNTRLKIKGFVFAQYDARSTITKQFTEVITKEAEAMGVKCLGSIRSGVALKEAIALQQSLFEYALKSKPAVDYMALYEQIEERG